MRQPLLAPLLLLATIAAPLRAQTTPAGRWQTISDVDGKPTAVIEIREVDGALVGVVRALLGDANPPDAVCDACPGEKRGQRIVGMEILWGMRPDGDGWSGGAILDPDNGKVYRANMHLEDDGKKLVVRGYIGFAMFGRSQSWLREPMPSAPAHW